MKVPEVSESKNADRLNKRLSVYSVSIIFGMLIVLGTAATLTWMIVSLIQTMPSPITQLNISNAGHKIPEEQAAVTGKTLGQNARAGPSVPKSNSPGVEIVTTAKTTDDAFHLDSASDISVSLPSQVELTKVAIGKQTRPLNCEFQTASDLA